MRRLVLLIFCVVVSLMSVSARSPREMQALINSGKDYLFRDTPVADSALECFSKVAESYSPQMSMRQKELCGTAANNLGFTYFYYYTDYRRAYEALTQAEKICRETGKVLTSVNVMLNLGNVYLVFSEHVDSPELAAEAERMYVDAFETARSNGLWHQMLSAFANLTTIDNDFRHLDRLSKIIDEFGDTDIPPSTPNYKFCRLRYKALKAIQSSDYPLATDYLKAHRDTIDADMTVEASRCQALSLLSAIYTLREMPDSAIVYADELLRFAVDNDVPEAKANAWRILEQCYRNAGNEDAAHDAHVNYLLAQDSLINHRSLRAIENLKFINELAAEKEKAGRMIAEADRKKRIREAIILVTLILLALSLPVIYIIIKRHRLLEASYQELFLRYQESLRYEDEKRSQRENEMKRDNSESADGRQNSFTVPQHALSNKTRILAVMDETDEIFSPDFSLERLAELVGMKPRVLSAILNDSFNTTFRDLLNSYRVREACRRLSDTGRYGNLTIEAISHGVGYRSRTSLVSAFKRETGLTPSEYQKMARGS